MREFKRFNSESGYLQHERTAGHECQYVGSTILENWINGKPCARLCARVGLIDILYLHLFLLGFGTALFFPLPGTQFTACSSLCPLIHFPANSFLSSVRMNWTDVVYWAFHCEFMSERFKTASNLGKVFSTNKNMGLASSTSLGLWEKMAAHLLTRILSTHIDLPILFSCTGWCYKPEKPMLQIRPCRLTLATALQAKPCHDILQFDHKHRNSSETNKHWSVQCDVLWSHIPTSNDCMRPSLVDIHVKALLYVGQVSCNVSISKACASWPRGVNQSEQSTMRKCVLRPHALQHLLPMKQRVM